MAGASAGSVDVLEGPLLRVPFESLKRAAKDRKSLLDEAQQQAQEALSQAAAQGGGGAAEKLTSLLSSLQSAKQRLEEVSRQERDEARRCKARLAHLQQLSEPRTSMVAWNAQRLDRLLADYLQRCASLGLFGGARHVHASASASTPAGQHLMNEARSEGSVHLAWRQARAACMACCAPCHHPCPARTSHVPCSK